MTPICSSKQRETLPQPLIEEMSIERLSTGLSISDLADAYYSQSTVPVMVVVTLGDPLVPVTVSV
jgi:hypothetical protein